MTNLLDSQKLKLLEAFKIYNGKKIMPLFEKELDASPQSEVVSTILDEFVRTGNVPAVSKYEADDGTPQLYLVYADTPWGKKIFGNKNDKREPLASDTLGPQIEYPLGPKPD